MSQVNEATQVGNLYIPATLPERWADYQNTVRELAVERARRVALEEQLRDQELVIGRLSFDLDQTRADLDKCHRDGEAFIVEQLVLNDRLVALTERLEARVARLEEPKFSSDEKADLIAAVELFLIQAQVSD